MMLKKKRWSLYNIRYTTGWKNADFLARKAGCTYTWSFFQSCFHWGLTPFYCWFYYLICHSCGLQLWIDWAFPHCLSAYSISVVIHFENNCCCSEAIYVYLTILFFLFKNKVPRLPYLQTIPPARIRAVYQDHDYLAVSMVDKFLRDEKVSCFSPRGGGFVLHSFPPPFYIGTIILGSQSSVS